MNSLDSLGEIRQFQPEIDERARTNAAIFLRNEEWHGNKGFVETHVPLSRKPLVIVGSAYPSCHNKFKLVESVDSALKTEGIKTGRIEVGWPRNWWSRATPCATP